MILKKKLKADAIFLQFSFFLTLSHIIMANQLYDKGCSDEFQRLDVDLNGNIVCSTVYDIGQVGGNGIPQIEFSSAENSKSYSVVMIDPDAPSHAHPKYRSWLHYLAVNVPGSVLRSQVSLSDLSPTVEYNPPSPPAGSGLHRYIIFVMEQSESVTPGSFPSRASFDVDAFAKQHQLEPVASNMFKTENQAK